MEVLEERIRRDGIVREGNGVAMEALTRMGISGDAVRNAVDRLTAGSSESRMRPAMADVRSGADVAGGQGPGLDAVPDPLHRFGQKGHLKAADADCNLAFIGDQAVFLSAVQDQRHHLDLAGELVAKTAQGGIADHGGVGGV